MVVIVLYFAGNKKKEWSQLHKKLGMDKFSGISFCYSEMRGLSTVTSKQARST